MSAKPPRRTRERILERSLRLFNDLGEPNVTASEIGDELRISPGNLYYHFANKEAIVNALFERFVYRDINDLLSRHRSLELGLQAIVARKAEAAGLLCRALADSGDLAASPAEIKVLTTNMAVVATGWLPYEYIANARRISEPAFQAASVERGTEQVVALLRPWLIPASRQRLDTMVARALAGGHGV